MRLSRLRKCPAVLDWGNIQLIETDLVQFVYVDTAPACLCAPSSRNGHLSQVRSGQRCAQARSKYEGCASSLFELESSAKGAYFESVIDRTVEVQRDTLMLLSSQCLSP